MARIMRGANAVSADFDAVERRRSRYSRAEALGLQVLTCRPVGTYSQKTAGNFVQSAEDKIPEKG